MSEARLHWGDVALIPDGTTNALPYRIEVLADGTTPGNPEAVITQVQSRLQDGSLGRVESLQNRDVQVRVKVSAVTYKGLAAGEKALVAESRREGYNTLKWTPDVALAPVSVFDVVYALPPAFEFEDLSELLVERYFTLTLSCLPSPHADTEIVTEAPLPPPVTESATTVSDGSSTSGWTGFPSPATVASGRVQTVTSTSIVAAGFTLTGWSVSGSTAPGTSLSLSGDESGGVVVVASNGSMPPNTGISLTYTAAIDTSLMKNLYVDVRFPGSDQGKPAPTSSIRIYLNGSSTPTPIIYTELIDKGANRYWRYWVQAPGSSVSAIRTEFFIVAGAAGSVLLIVDDVVQTSTNPTDQSTMRLTRTGTIDLSTKRYLYADYAATGLFDSAPQVLIDGAPVTPFFTQVLPSGLTRVWCQVPAPTMSSFQLRATYRNGGTFVRTLALDQLVATDTGPVVGSRRQLSRSLPVRGTVRTQGRLSIEHESSALGEVLVYLYQDHGTGSQPALRPFAVNNATLDTTDAANRVSGATNMLDTQLVFSRPVSTFVGGNHRWYAMLKGSAPGAVTLNLTASTRIGTTDLPGGWGESVVVNLTTSWAIYDLAGLSLPTTKMAAAGGTVRLTMVDADTSGIDVLIDEAWAFNLDIGTLSHIDCGTGTPAAGGPAKRLRFDPAMLTNDGMDAIYIGHSADWSDAFNPGPKVKGYTPPIFEPDAMTILTVTTNALDAAARLAHSPRYLHNVGVE